jgi:hypothetical protein
MRAKSFEFNGEHPNNEAIMRDMRIMSGDEVNIDLTEISNMRSDYHRNSQPQRKMQRKSQPQRPNNNNRKQMKSSAKGPVRHNNHK